ncbi:MAG: hypothetical protein GQ536_07625 [Candidatus Aminicenantes bacterium]|nr:hypothetical protein [Candidatus Aminicenantes bacterium]
MKFREKTAIFIVAVLITFVGFSLIAAPSECMLRIGKEAGNEIIANYLANAANNSTVYCFVK